jgi:hypothetical protein
LSALCLGEEKDALCLRIGFLSPTIFLRGKPENVVARAR